ncbi:MAG: hypothetical protein ABJB12_10140 [Pseudomonadota bacterium]
MLRCLAMGLIEGLVIGLVLGVAATRGLGLSAPGIGAVCLLGAVAGWVVGLVAGRPVWARDGKTEALLKAGAGALAGAGLAFAAAHRLHVGVDLSAFRLGAGPAGRLPSAILPLIATVLALFFELDDDGPGRPAKRIAPASSKQRLPSPKARTAEFAELEQDEAKDSEQRGKR